MPPKSKPLPKGKSMVRCRSFDAEGRPIDGGCRFGDSCHFLHPPWPEESVRKRRSVTPEEQRRRRESRYNTPPMDNYDRRPGARSRSRSRSPLRSARPRPHPRPRGDHVHLHDSVPVPVPGPGPVIRLRIRVHGSTGGSPVQGQGQGRGRRLLDERRQQWIGYATGTGIATVTVIS
ncbi:hypothetical protein FRC14_005495 [Serendipita sp. 396]|nr:hypothetical protein FRC14_005495 [Serendipita sp. 396]